LTYSVIIYISSNIYFVDSTSNAGIQNGYKISMQLVNINYANCGQKVIHCDYKILHI